MPRAPVSPFRAGLFCRCPRCGEGKLFRSFLKVAERCASCGLDLGKEDSGDGPAVFVMFITGPVVVGLALWTEITFHPPYWLHFVLWIPTVLGLSLAVLQPLKALLIALQYRHRAGEGGRNTFT